ncbi:MAG: penicillin-binding protein 2 [Phoenicibacter congonensis]|uniref:Penicillin-binding protein 2 n=1 Tax=Phoenicibacter congonensis TaxID=1944646 RepID=A0AA43RJ75_9ACTN|nr:penicillin-binding protein 2 [Phoenicibacter congonensis]
MQKSRFSETFGPIFLMLGAVLLLIFARLFYIVFIAGEDYAAQAEATRTNTIPISAKRGTIYDRNGNAIAISVESTTVSCNPSMVKDASGVAKALVEIYGGEESDYYEKLTKENATFNYLYRMGDVDKGEKLSELMEQEPDKFVGVYCTSEARREYPYGSVGGQLIGRVNNDGEAICGLELEYDDILKGTDGEYVVERNETGDYAIPGSVKLDVEAVNGQDIMVSIDITMQTQVEQIISEKAAVQGESANAILMDSSTGEIYAMCSTPYFNPADPSESESGSDVVSPITTALEPGSMMKTITAMGLLESGTMTPESSVDCPVILYADEYEISDAFDRGATSLTLDQILTHSSNVGISLASDNIGAEGIYNNLQKSKVLKATGIDFPGEAAGYVTTPENWSNIARYNITFGQGVTVTPLAMARFYAAICNNGTAVTPHFLLAKTQTGERPTYDTTNLGYSETTLSDIKGMLHNVVENNESNEAGIDGFDVCGKTSTAEYSLDGSEYVTGNYNVGFCGFLNNTSLPLTCYVGITHSEATVTTTEVFHDIMKSAIEKYGIASIG